MPKGVQVQVLQHLHRRCPDRRALPRPLDASITDRASGPPVPAIERIVTVVRSSSTHRPRPRPTRWISPSQSDDGQGSSNRNRSSSAAAAGALSAARRLVVSTNRVAQITSRPPHPPEELRHGAPSPACVSRNRSIAPPPRAPSLRQAAAGRSPGPASAHRAVHPRAGQAQHRPRGHATDGRARSRKQDRRQPLQSSGNAKRATIRRAQGGVSAVFHNPTPRIGWMNRGARPPATDLHPQMLGHPAIAHNGTGSHRPAPPRPSGRAIKCRRAASHSRSSPEVSDQSPCRRAPPQAPAHKDQAKDRAAGPDNRTPPFGNWPWCT